MQANNNRRRNFLFWWRLENEMYIYGSKKNRKNWIMD
ncbi:serine acetyltransferase [Salmonella enterica subsp. enterica serovar Typhimurium]|nr:serine acetyltransferase [Salmonella enterica subsp. enterica serovar Typhimurium]